jgi:cysteinyl-tRNA synthetase
MIEKLLETGHAYEVDGSVYFSVESFPQYGKLSGRKVDELVEGARVAINDDKKHPSDFALWKKATPDHLMHWQSPWGEGYPGWHIECSVMSQKYLGETFDIHGGGIENQFPHHECEIAQSESVTGKQFAGYWLHNNMLTIDGVKMGKSLGNFTTVREILEKYSAATVRLFVLSSHYRSVTDFSDEALSAAEKGVERINNLMREIDSRQDRLPVGDASPETKRVVEEARGAFNDAMDDDFNTPTAVGAIFDLVRSANTVLADGGSIADGDLALFSSGIKEMAVEVLGLPLFSDGALNDDGLTDQVMDVLLAVRSRLRQEKNWSLADELRDRLVEIGVEIKDHADLTTWSRST